jgi:DNA-binding IclR family transcriptional regulator
MPRTTTETKASEPSPSNHAPSEPASTSAAKEHRTVSRVVTILEFVAAAEPSGVRLPTLATVLDAPKSSIHGLLQGLVARGYLLSEGGEYRIGPAPAALLTPSRPPVAQLALRPMEQLRDRFGETASLSELVGDSYVYIATVESNQMIRFSAPIGQRSELYPRSPGKVYLAAMTERRVKSYFAAHLAERFAFEDVLADLVEVRRRGYSINRGESLPGLSAVAAGVVVVNRVKFTLSVAAPSERIVSRIAEIGMAVRDSAALLSRELA